MADHNCKCSVEACGLPARSSKAKYCEKHYMRLRRHGSTERLSTLKPGLIEHTSGYLMEHCPGHPLARSTSRVYQHRVVYHAKHGAGPFACHWCSVQVEWDTLHIDHLDDDVANNEISNLVASCPRCNQERGIPKMRMTMKRSGRLLTAHGKTMCVSDWAVHLGLARWTIMGRIARGMPLVDALSPNRSGSGGRRRRQPQPSHVVDLALP